MTALTATPLATSAGCIRLDVTGAPAPPSPVYASNFSASVDSWTGAAVVGYDPGGGGIPPSLEVATTTGSTNSLEATRTVTGLTVGQLYEYRVKGSTYYGSLGLIARTTGGATIASLPNTAGDGSRTLRFTATATSHVLVLKVSPEFTNVWQGGAQITVVTLTAVTSWVGTSITRTDINGTKTVRMAVGQDVAVGGSTLTVYDYEAALIGKVTYTVTDGTGGSATAPSVSLSEYRRNYLTDPMLVSATGWTGVSAGGAITASSVYSPNQTAAVGQTWTDAVDITAPAGNAVSGSIAARPTTATAFGPTSYTLVPFTVSAGQTLRVGATTMLAVGGGTPDGVRLYIQFTTFTGATISRAMLTRGTDGSYFDGSTTGSGASQYFWTVTANASASVMASPLSSPGVWLTLPATADPAAGIAPTNASLTSVIDYGEAGEFNGSLHKIIGRADPIANPGPLALRSGSLDVWCADYASAQSVRALLAVGEVALLRQGDYLDMDLYFIADRVEIRPAETTTSQPWIVTVGYAEVLAP